MSVTERILFPEVLTLLESDISTQVTKSPNKAGVQSVVLELIAVQLVKVSYPEFIVGLPTSLYNKGEVLTAEMVEESVAVITKVSVTGPELISIVEE